MSKPTPEEAAALLRSQVFVQLVSNLLDGLGVDRAAIWALADTLESQGYHQAADALRGQVAGACTWAITGADSWAEESPGGPVVHLRLSAIGKVIQADDADGGINDPSGWTAFPGRKQR